MQPLTGQTSGRLRLLALLAATGTGVQTGAAIVASRYLAEAVPPFTLALLRYTIGALCLLPFVLMALRRQQELAPALGQGRNRRDWLMIGLLGVGQFGLLVALLNMGLQHLSAANAALIFSLMPVLTLLLSAWAGHERLGLTLSAGVLLCVAGVALALGPKLVAAHGASWWGEIAVLGSAALGAACSLAYRPYVRRYPTLLVSFTAMLGSVLALLAMAHHEKWPGIAAGLNGLQWSAVVFIGLSSALGYSWWLYALKHLPPTRVTVFLSLSPLTAAMLGHWLLSEAPHAAVLGGIVLTGLGLWLATRREPDRPG